jgi:prepilin-type N-terminal cleavage/methylation domain-containing protein/prepilin-type processing-associated H-X9-DG protein
MPSSRPAAAGATDDSGGCKPHLNPAVSTAFRSGFGLHSLLVNARLPLRTADATLEANPPRPACPCAAGAAGRSCGRGPAPHRVDRRGFNLIELLVVLSVVTILVGTLMPGLRVARDSANRIICASNLRHLSGALHTYATDFRERLPHSVHANSESPRPTELMAATAGPDALGLPRFDGLGLLAIPGRSYVDSPRCLYCPSHTGEHSLDRYARCFNGPVPFEEQVYTNYHYRGHRDAATGRLILLSGERRAIVADGMRTRADFNHRIGTNVLFTDGSVAWFVDNERTIVDRIPLQPPPDNASLEDQFAWIWQRLDRE